MKTTAFVLAASLTGLPVLAQSNYWIANRTSSDIMRVSEWGSVLERVATPTNLRRCEVAPDGKVWIVRFIQPTFDIYDPATATMTPVALPSGSAYAIAFDANGHAWITNGATAVHEFDASGVFVQTYTMPANSSLGITVDGLGNKWIAHRVSPGSVTRIDPTGAITNFPIAGIGTLLPTGIVADYRGILQPSHVWVTGDSANQLVEIDGATGATLNLYPVPTTSTAYPPTFDKNGRIWVSSFGNGTVVQIDQTNGSVLQTLTLPPNGIGIATDNVGRIRLTSRSATGVACEVRRVDPNTGALEIPTILQSGTFLGFGTQAALSTQFQYSLVVNPAGDLDGDGDANFVEITNGTSPTDATSNSNFSIESIGSTMNGSTPSFEVLAGPAQLWLVGFATTLIAPTPVPGFGGTLRLDLSTLALTTAGIGNLSLPIAIPANPGLIGVEFFTQGVTWNGASFDFANVSGMKIW
ncbi:MAG: hypothetical protein JNK15_24990 [Planctomycetes bacterium]|nr:hypothetical protein [Planctomycetota bacterium]